MIKIFTVSVVTRVLSASLCSYLFAYLVSGP